VSTKLRVISRKKKDLHVYRDDIYFRYEQCGCTNPYLWSGRWVMNMTTRETIAAHLCNKNNKCFVEAMNQLLDSPSLFETYCSDCTEECSITDFIIQTSSLVAPYEWQKNDIKILVENSTVPLPSDWSTAWNTYITANYLSISVVRLSGVVENSTQTATIGLVDVLSAIGGQSGLWIGISFLSIMEAIEMVYRLLRYQCHQIYTAIRRQNTVVSQ
jgi:Amiloride-sensitive sodium channel